MSWPNLADLIVDAGTQAPIGLVGAPLATGSVTPGRCDLAPAELRKVLRRIGRYDIDTRRELGSLIADHGDVAIDGLTIADATGPIREVCAASVSRHELTLLIGGNNAVTRPGLHALDLHLEKIGLITLDAHFDMRSTADGLANGNPVRALLEDGLSGANVAQVGLAPFANSFDMHRDAEAAGNLVVTQAEVDEAGIDAAVDRALAHVGHCEALMVDCDIDVIDRSQFPAAPGARPCGMQARDFFAAVRKLAAHPKLRIIDLTEWDPPLDPTDLSSLVAGRWLAEVVAGFEAR
ncbi:arginase family protein [Sphingomicrobium sediminis]|uniref:Arginase family protein n=1 Tax=Sphingomicrobium sediminis TaxID=2950949 RepID=A0A9X2EMR0_9SPHN|nr:arginase family protein [Sphingomicrobium sediminis]MCM8558244.1 arginase family protein [Sphingomicrobium sediminis]